MGNLHIFENQTDLNKYVDSQYQEPFVSTVSGEGSSVSVKYNLKPEEIPSLEETLLTFVITSVGYIKWVASDESFTKTIEYTKDNGVTWNSITSSTEGVSFRVNAGDVVQFRGNNASYSQSITQYNSFDSSTCKFYVRGNVMSLVDSVNYATATTFSDDYVFYSLFENCTGLTDISELVLPATSLTDYCYAYMFYGCTSLCKSMTLGNIEDLYYTVPTANTVSLPSLPATTLAASCYNSMFAGCTEITTAPVLSAETLVESCYAGMFSGCSSLNYIEMLATNISATSALTNWVYGVAPSGIFVKNPDLSSIPINSVDGVPIGWTIEGNLTYLAFEILTGGTINWKSSVSSLTRTIEYSKDDGKT